MQGVDTDAVVGIGILPRMRDVRIVDGQYLQNTLLGLVAPVDHHLQIAEVAYTKTTLATQRENRNHGTCTLPRINREISLCEFIDHHVALLHLWQNDGAVRTILPKWGYIDLLVESDKLKLKRTGKCVGIETDGPLVVLVLIHIEGTLRLPVAQGIASTNQCQALDAAQLRGTNLQTDGLAETGGIAHLAFTRCHTIRKG